MRRALQRAAALQLQATCSAASSGVASAGALPALAAAMQRLAVQQTSWSAALLGGARQFAAGGGSGEQPPAAAAASTVAGEVESEEGPAQLHSESGRLQFEDSDQALEAWGQAMDEGGQTRVGERKGRRRSSERHVLVGWLRTQWPTPFCWCACIPAVAATDSPFAHR